MKYQVWTKYWHENDVGERGEGPWIRRGQFDKIEDAEADARGLHEIRNTGGTYTRVSEEKE